MRLKVAHIVPRMGIGGVEVAIYRSISALRERFDYQVYCVKALGQTDVGQKPIHEYLVVLLNSWNRPNVVVTSLWWSHPFGMLAKAFGIQWIMFLHSSGFASFPDRIVTTFASKFADYFFYDSERTKASMLEPSGGRQFLISFLIGNVNEKSLFNEQPEIDICWAGRNSPEKRPDLVANIIADLLKIRPQTIASISVAGVRYDPFDKLAVKFPKNFSVHYNATPDEVSSRFQQSKITMCVSDYEGFSMATAEAALYGNLIAARKVGDLTSYLPVTETIWLEDEESSSLDRFVSTICKTLANAQHLAHRRRKTHEKVLKFSRGGSYVTSFVESVFKVASDLKND